MLAILAVVPPQVSVSSVNGQVPDKVAEPTHSPVAGCSPAALKIFRTLDTVKAGEIVEFEIQSERGEKILRGFNWTTSTGTIVSGQGTSHIKVLTPADALAAKAPTPTPTPTDSGGYFLFGFRGRRFVSLLVTASPLAKSSCNDTNFSTELSIGNQSVAANGFADVLELILNENEISKTCNSTVLATENNPTNETVVDVSVKALDPKNDVLTYSYTVSAGKVVGMGAKVKWDLSGVASGVYSITVGVDDGCGVCGKTITKTITIAKCF